MYRCNKRFYVFLILVSFFTFSEVFLRFLFKKPSLKIFYQVVGKAILKPQEKILYAIDVVIYLV